MDMRTTRFVATAAAIAFLLGGLAFALVAAPVFHLGAFGPAASAKPSTSASPSPGARKAEAQAACDAFLADFAKQLGVSPDKVKTSLRTAVKDAIDRAVASGKMSADQATKAKARVDNVKGCESMPAFGKRFGGFGGGMAAFAGITNAAATALGISPDDLRAGVMAGKTLHQLAGNKSQADFDTAFRAALSKDIQPQVDSGKITADQAKTRLDQAVAMADKLWDKSLKDAAGSFFGKRGGGPRPGPGAPTIQ
jgi:polyhydroxyalkanoate synthesis regulator phasin